jgi:hypothetical protein
MTQEVEKINLQTDFEKLSIDEEPKKKKGRPKKTIESVTGEPGVAPVDNGEATEEKKKRGRKKKEPVEDDGKVKVKKKRGRKAAVKYFSSSIRKKIPLTASIQNNNNYILHLDIKDNDDADDGNTFKAQENSVSISSMFRKNLLNEEIKGELQNLLDNDKTILSDYIDNNDDTDLHDLYENRIKFRETQDQLLVKKLEEMHKDDALINSMTNNEAQYASDNNSAPHNTTAVEEDIQATNKKKGYFELLYKFVHSDEWLEKTDVSCWWCCHDFDTTPIGMPVDFDKKTKKFRVKGIFCSFACMMSYKDDKRKDGIEYLIKYLHKCLTGDGMYNQKLHPAPPRWSLKKFGGELTIDEFRSSTNERKIYRMVEYPMFVSKDYVEEVDIQNVNIANIKLFN